MKKLFIASILLMIPCIGILYGCEWPKQRAGMTQNGPDTTGIRYAPLTEPVDSILVIKKHRAMYVYNKGKVIKAYRISLGSCPIGPKHFKDDRKTPEGLYYINGKNPNSAAHKNLGISYPNDSDRTYARRYGKSTGGDVKIHGIMNGWENDKEAFDGVDWTWGCIAVTNEEIDELYAHVSTGIPINILP